MASAHENVQGCVTYHERPASTPCDAPPAAPTARGRARRQVPPANKNTVSFRVCIRSADCSSDLCPFAILSSSSCPCFRRWRHLLALDVALSSDLERRHDRCSSASGRPCRLACGPGVCGGIPTTSEADSCCQAVEGCTTVECEKAAPQPAQAGLGCSAQTVLVSSGGTGCCVNQASHCNGSVESNTRKRGPSAGTGGGICRRALDRVEGGRWIECKMTHR